MTLPDDFALRLLKWEGSRHNMEKADTQFPGVVELNVGGKFFATSLTTLLKAPDSMLAAIFSGRHTLSKDKDGRYFIDCDGDVFAFILEYLRFGTLPSGEIAPRVLTYSDYFNISELRDGLENAIAEQSKLVTEIEVIQAEPRQHIYTSVLTRLKLDSERELSHLPYYVDFLKSGHRTGKVECRNASLVERLGECKSKSPRFCLTPRQFQQLPLELCTDIHKMGYLVKYRMCTLHACCYGNNEHFMILIACCEDQDKPSQLDWTYCTD